MSETLDTDSNYGAGLPAGQYTLPNDWGPVAIAGPNNGVRLVERGMSLAGGALTPIEAFRNAVHMFGKDIANASQVCSSTPARLLKLDKGEIAVGKEADIIIVNPDLNLLHTVVAGDSAFSRQ